jgi:hypothetical protein
MYGGYPGMEPPELSSIKSMLNLARIFVLIFLILSLLAGIGYLLVALAFAVVGFIGFALIGPFFFLIGFVILLLLYINIRQIQRMVDAGQYQQAKDKSLIWMILGFIFGFLLTGIFILLAYIKFDALIAWQRQQQMGGQPPAQGSWGQPPAQPTWGAPPAQAQPAWSPPAQSPPQQTWNAQPPAAPMAAPVPVPVAAPPQPAAGTCMRCGKPATWVAQYNRWYCYSCQQYV